MDIYFNKIHDPVSGAEVADMHRATEAGFASRQENSSNGCFHRNRLMTPLLPSVIRVGWTA
jgi:hypothetical protein